MTIKFDHLCPMCQHLAHISYDGNNVVHWCDNCGATGFRRIAVRPLLGILALADFVHRIGGA